MKEIRGFATVMQLGWVVALGILLPLGLGLWLDRQFSTSPLFILAGAVLGILVGTVGAVRMALRNMAAAEQRHPPKEDCDSEEGAES